jgi:hypothetical protein
MQRGPLTSVSEDCRFAFMGKDVRCACSHLKACSIWQIGGVGIELGRRAA